MLVLIYKNNLDHLLICCLSQFFFLLLFSAPNDFSFSAKRFFNLRQLIFDYEEHGFHPT